MKWYIGIESTGKRVAFLSARTPTETSHPAYQACIGPFRTKYGALWGEIYSKNNPHAQTVDDMERLALRELGIIQITFVSLTDNEIELISCLLMFLDQYWQPGIPSPKAEIVETLNTLNKYYIDLQASWLHRRRKKLVKNYV